MLFPFSSLPFFCGYYSIASFTPLSPVAAIDSLRRPPLECCLYDKIFCPFFLFFTFLFFFGSGFFEFGTVFLFFFCELSL